MGRYGPLFSKAGARLHYVVIVSRMKISLWLRRLIKSVLV